MAKERGRYLPISPFRRLVVDLMRLSRKVPSVTAERYMDLSPLIEARLAAAARPTWTSMFTKAYAIVARAYPELRRCYVSFPWGRFYEHPHNIATLNIERKIGEENAVLYCLVRSPENRALAEIDEIIRHHKEAPLEEVRSYKRSMALAKCPGLIRRFVWWASLNLFGRRRCHNFGTFGLTTVGAQGAGILQLVPLLTSTIFYGLFDKDGGLDVRLAWDHRVFDGATAARVLVDLEQALKREILQEVRERSPRLAAA